MCPSWGSNYVSLQKTQVYTSFPDHLARDHACITIHSWVHAWVLVYALFYAWVRTHGLTQTKLCVIVSHVAPLREGRGSVMLFPSLALRSVQRAFPGSWCCTTVPDYKTQDAPHPTHVEVWFVPAASHQNWLDYISKLTHTHLGKKCKCESSVRAKPFVHSFCLPGYDLCLYFWLCLCLASDNTVCCLFDPCLFNWTLTLVHFWYAWFLVLGLLLSWLCFCLTFSDYSHSLLNKMLFWYLSLLPMNSF